MSRAALPAPLSAPASSPPLAAAGSLYRALAQVPECRQAQGRRHPLPAVLALGCAAMLCGARSAQAVAEWGRNYDPELMTALGFTHLPPCASTFRTIFCRLDWEAFATQLRLWAEALLAATGAPEDGEAREALAIDGKTLRGSRKQGLPEAHLLSVVSHRLGLTLTHAAVPEKTNEITAVQEVLRRVVLEGRVVTVDALLTQREIAATILARGGAYVMVVKGNQPQLEADIAAVFAHPAAPGEHREEASTASVGHGRVERRRLTTSDVLVGYSPWPGLAQVFMLERRVIRKKTGEVRESECMGSAAWRRERLRPRRCWRIPGGIGPSRTARTGCGT